MKIKNYSLNFFGSINGDFSVSPQSYHSVHRKAYSAKKAFLGPWDYANNSASPIKSKFVSPQEQPKKASVQRGGFISPVNDISIRKTKTYSFGANRTQALSGE